MSEDAVNEPRLPDDRWASDSTVLPGPAPADRSVEDALRLYGRHRSDCGVYIQADRACTCGFAAALSSFAGRDGLREALERAIRVATENDFVGLHDLCSIEECWIVQARAALPEVDHGA